MIAANTCPYCGAAYTLAAGGCVARCPDMTRVHDLIRQVCDEDERRPPDEPHEDDGPGAPRTRWLPQDARGDDEPDDDDEPASTGDLKPDDGPWGGGFAPNH